MRLNRIAVMCAFSATALLAGCRQDMHDQPKFYPQRGTTFYPDGRSVRPQVENTVARGQLHEDTYFYTGMKDGKEGDGLPFPVTLQVLEKGQERYNVYCTPCHSRVGNGGGMIVQRGYSQAGNFLGGRLRAVGLGHFFNVMTNGYGAMPDYAAQLTPADRWAVAAYIRALQLSQSAQRSDVPSGVEVKPLASIVETEGLPASFAEPWEVSSPTPQPGANSSSTLSAPSTKPVGATPTGADPASPNVNLGTGAAQAAAIVPKAEKAKVSVADVKAGQELYEKNCVVCHGEDRAGHPPTFPSLIGVVQRVGVEHIRNNIHNGAAPMPAFPQITPEQQDQIIAFLGTPVKASSTVTASK